MTMLKQRYVNLLIQSTKDWRFWTKLLIGITQITSVIIFLTVGVVIEHDPYLIPEHLSYFTTWSNIFCAIFFIYSAMFHYAEGKGKFDNNEVAKIVITYLTITILIYNINQLMAADPYTFESWKFVMSLICEHSVVPLLAIIYCLFFYNHENTKDIKEFSKKWIWYMILGLVVYLTFFSVMGLIARFFNWKPLFGTIDGSGEPSTFVYPFLDWYHGVGFFKPLPSWFECIIMLSSTLIVAALAEYMYSFIIIKVSKSKWQKKIIFKQKTANTEFIKQFK